MSVPTEGFWDHSLYLLRNGTAESAYATNGMLRATSVKAAMDVLQGTADAAYHAVDDLDVTVETLAAGSTGSGELVGDMPNKTLRLRLPRGEQGPGVGEGIASITSGRGFWPLRKALAAGTARVVAMGDSKTEGTGVETVSQRWLNQLMGTLRARYAPDGDQGLGYLPAYYATFYGFPSAPTTSGSAVAVGNGGGLGNRSRHLASGGSVTWSVPAWTSGVPLLVHWTQHPGHGSLQVVTGGTVRATIDTDGATIESKVTAVTIPAGTTSITIRQSGTGAARIEGIVHRTKTSGVIVYDAARSGAKLVDYAQGLVSDGAPLSDDWHFQAVASVQPHAVFLAFGANDQSDVDLGGRTPQQWGADLKTVVAKAKAAAPGAGIIVLHGAQRTEDVTADPERVLKFEAAARAAVGADPDVTILYESTLWAPTAGVDYTGVDPSGWLADTVHVSPAGNAQIARYLAAQITGADAATDALEAAEKAIQPALTAAQAAQAAAENASSNGARVIRSANLFIKSTAFERTGLTAGSGTPSTSSVYALSDYIPVMPGGDYTFAGGANRITWFTASHVYISDRGGLAEGTVQPAPSTAAWARLTVTMAGLHTAQMNAGSTLLPYDVGIIPRLAPESAPDVLLATDQTTFFDQPTNLFSKHTAIPGMILSAGASTPTPNSQYHVSDWIPINALTDYTVAGDPIRITFFDSARAWVGDQSFPVPSAPITFNTPARARWARLSIRNASVETAQLNAGNTALPYEVGGATLRPELMPDFTPEDIGAERVRPVIDANLRGTFTAPAALPDMAWIADSTVADVYSAYDALVAAHPTYVTSTQIGASVGGGIPLNCYRFNQAPPTNTSGFAAPHPRAKVVIVTATHGNEKATVWSTHALMDLLCTTPGADPILQGIRDNVDIVIVPVANPSGYRDNTRPNARGVDLARNWPTGWFLGDPLTTTYGGDAPLSEPETVAMKSVLDAHPDALLVLDFHNFHTPADSYTFLYGTPPNARTAEVNSALVRRMDRKWKVDEPTIVSQDPDVYIGNSSAAPGGSLGPEAIARGHDLGLTFEMCWRVFAQPGSENYHGLAMTWGMEALANFLTIAIRA